jgi:hypothetical protein
MHDLDIEMTCRPASLIRTRDTLGYTSKANGNGRDRLSYR